MNVKIMSLLGSKYVHVKSVYYVQLLYIHMMLKKCQKRVNIIFVRDQKQNKNICADENTSFYFIRTKK